jgi:hypothetical protein
VQRESRAILAGLGKVRVCIVAALFFIYQEAQRIRAVKAIFQAQPIELARGNFVQG